MSDKAPWRCPQWFNAENIERYERMVEALHEVVRATRSAADRLATPADVSGWEARVTAIAKDADEWAGRLGRLGRKEEPPAPQE